VSPGDWPGYQYAQSRGSPGYHADGPIRPSQLLCEDHLGDDTLEEYDHLAYTLDGGPQTIFIFTDHLQHRSRDTLPMVLEDRRA